MKFLPSLFALCLCLLFFVSGMIWGREIGYQSHLVMEVKVLRSAISEIQLSGSEASWREFVLARYYRLLSRLGDGRRGELAEDFGPVDPSRIESVSVDKTPGNPREDYETVRRTLLERKAADAQQIGG